MPKSAPAPSTVRRRLMCSRDMSEQTNPADLSRELVISTKTIRDYLRIVR